MTLPEGWLVESEATELTRLAQDRIVLELGSWKGRSTVVLAKVARYVVSVDHHREMPARWGVAGDSFAAYFSNVRELANVGSLVAEFSAVSLFREDAFGLVFVDGLHDFDSVTADLVLAGRFECPLALHDWGRYEVEKAVRALGREPDRVVGSLAVFE